MGVPAAKEHLHHVLDLIATDDLGHQRLFTLLFFTYFLVVRVPV